MAEPEVKEKFINWITGTPISLFAALSSVFNKSGPDATIGLVPSPGTTPGTGNFLREDGTWGVPPGTPSSTFVAAGASHAGGLVPDPGVTAHTPPYFLMDDATFKNFVSQGYMLINGTIAESHTGNAATLAIKTLLGADPSSTDVVYIVFRNATAATGDYTVLPITSAFSITISSGSTMGATNGTAFRLWLVCFNDAGTARLGVIRCLNTMDIYPLAAWQIASSTAEGGIGGADSAGVFYTGSAVAAKPYTILGYLTWETGLTTAGTWDASPTRIQVKDNTTPLPGQEVQYVESVDKAEAHNTGTIPYDNTIPQVGEGSQFMAKTVTPISAANILRFSGQVNLSLSSNATTLAIFKDGANNAVYANACPINAAAFMAATMIHYNVLAGSTVAQAYTLRAGGTAGTTTFNGSTSVGLYGGVAASYLVIREIMT